MPHNDVCAWQPETKRSLERMEELTSLVEASAVRYEAWLLANGGNAVGGSKYAGNGDVYYHGGGGAVMSDNVFFPSRFPRGKPAASESAYPA